MFTSNSWTVKCNLKVRPLKWKLSVIASIPGLSAMKPKCVYSNQKSRESIQDPLSDWPFAVGVGHAVVVLARQVFGLHHVHVELSLVPRGHGALLAFLADFISRHVLQREDKLRRRRFCCRLFRLTKKSTRGNMYFSLASVHHHGPNWVM